VRTGRKHRATSARSPGPPHSTTLYGEFDDRAMTNLELTGFTRQASEFWMAIPADTRAKLLANVYCGQCRGAVSIVNVKAMVKRGDLLLNGNCATCGHEVARLVEGPGT
jgi:hypothetical protein